MVFKHVNLPNKRNEGQTKRGKIAEPKDLAPGKRGERGKREGKKLPHVSTGVPEGTLKGVSGFKRKKDALSRNGGRARKEGREWGRGAKIKAHKANLDNAT